MTEWSDDIETVLGHLRENCITLYKYHLGRYYQYKRILPFFKIPVLILSAFNSVFSVGLQPYLQQSLISILICIVSLGVTIINSIELYMGIQKSLETEMCASQGFYLLSIDIYKMITLRRENRDVSGKQYLADCYNVYQELIKQSKLIHDPSLRDTLQIIYKSNTDITEPTASSKKGELITINTNSIREQIGDNEQPHCITTDNV
jgi:hypothetical protein